MNNKSYSIKDITEMTGLSVAKIRALIKDGTIKAEMKEAICGKRKCKRLEVTEEDLVAFACANPDLAGPLMNMEFIKKYTTPTVVDNNVEASANPGDHDIAESTSETIDEERDAMIPDTPFIAIEELDVTDEKEEIDDDLAKQEIDTTGEDPENVTNTEKDEMLASLRNLQQIITDSISTISAEVKYHNDIVAGLVSKSAELGKQLNNIERVIKHIDEHM